jgi:hypothetical protein
MIADADALPYPLSYSMNNWVSRRRLDSFKAPTHRVGLLLQEDIQSIDDGDFYWAGWAYGTEGHNRPSSVHNGGTCVLFCDLHAKWQSHDSVMQDLKNLAWNPEEP